MAYSLILGGVIFDDFEVPGDLRNLAGELKIALNKFVGGMQSAQILGPFPAVKRWTGIMYGNTAFQRAQTLENLWLQAQSVTLEYGIWSFSGLITDLDIDAKNQYEVHYTVEFTPIDDSSQIYNGGNGGQPAPSPTQTANQAGQIAQQQLNNPPSNFSFPSNITGPANSLFNGLAQAATANNGSLQNLPPATLSGLLNQISNLQSSLSSFQTGSDPVAASAATDLNNTLSVLSQSLQKSGTPQATLTASNPDLFRLASQFYGDWTQWQIIADANGLIDPLPTGQFTLTIPPAPAPVPPVVTWQ